MNLARKLATGAAAIGMVAAGLLAATPAQAATTGDNCGTNTDWGYYNCMYIGGGIIRGWSHQTNTDQLGAYVHEGITGPGGYSCSGTQAKTTSTSQIINCQTTKAPVAGTYCSTVWVWNQAGGAFEPTYYDGGQNCLNIS
jgi:hypothetical protein